VRDVNPYLTGLDLEEAETTTVRLDGHLLAAVQRSNSHRTEAHLFHLEVRAIDQYGKGAGQVLFRWALPAPPEGV
jgi:hypothetical protein